METTATSTPASTPEPKRRFNPFRAIGTALLFVLVLVRVLIRKLFTLLALLILALGKNKPATAIGVVLLALLLWTWSQNGVPWAPPPNAAAASLSAGASNPMIEPSPWVQQFIQAGAAHDGYQAWESFSDELKEALRREGIGPESIDRQFKQEQSLGVQWMEATHVASTRLSDGKMVYLYIVTHSSPRGMGQVPYTFTTMPNGKILQFE